jgi:hypothetical protein
VVFTPVKLMTVIEAAMARQISGVPRWRLSSAPLT